MSVPGGARRGLDYGYDTVIYGGATAYWYLTNEAETTP
jgi:hypothetical protein